MIERWFPCAEVSEASASGWGSGKSEKALFTWFAARPLAQAKAAVLTSLLPWPEDETEQRRLQDLVRTAMTGRDAAHAELVAELAKTYPDGASMLDPFSGRAMIPLEAARLGVTAHGIDYSPVATLAGQLLADYPLRDWAGEPDLPFGTAGHAWHRRQPSARRRSPRLGRDRQAVRRPDGRGVPDGRRQAAVGIPVGSHPSLPGVRPPLPLDRVARPAASLAGQRRPRTELPHRGGPANRRVPSGRPRRSARRASRRSSPACRAEGQSGARARSVRSATTCTPKATHTTACCRRARARTRCSSPPISTTRSARSSASRPPRSETRSRAGCRSFSPQEPTFAPGIPAVPDERIPVGNSDTVRASVYGARTYGDLCNTRQTLGFVRLARVISRTWQRA